MFHKHVLSMFQMFTEEGRKNKYASLYNHSIFVVASIHSLVFDTTSESAYITKNIESHCPIVPLYWWCLQSNNDHEPFMFCAAAFVSSRNAPPSFLICCHQQLMNSRRSLANRKGSIQAETGRKKESNINEPKYLQQVIWQPENAHRTKQFCQALSLMKSSTLMGILFKPRHIIFMMYI